LLNFIGLFLGPVANVNATAHYRQNHQQNKNQESPQNLSQHAAALGSRLERRVGGKRDRC
jgi:hypothetical protein